MEPLDVVPASAVGAQAWDDFVDASDDAWFWHSSVYRDAIATWRTREDISYAVLSAGRIVGVLPLHAVRLRLGRVLPFAELDSQGGPAFAPDLDDAQRAVVSDHLGRHVRRLAQAQGARAVRIRTTPLAAARQGTAGCMLGGAVEAGLTWLSDLKGGPDAIWPAMQGRARTSIRKAEKAGVTVRAATAEDLDAYYALHVENYGRTNVRPHSRDYFKAIWQEVLPTGRCLVLLAECGSTTVAAQNFALYKSGAWYWTGAASDAGLRTGANALLQWRGMCEAEQRGIRWFDHGEAFPDAVGKLRGLSDFKRSFGGEATRVEHAVIDVSGPLWHGVLRAHSLAAAAARRPQRSRR